MNQATKTTDDQKELFVVVDENDNVIGYKTRGQCHSNKNLIHRGSGVIIFNDKGEMLLQKRSETKDLFSGFFTISASGHVNKGESYEDATKREMFEEIGIKSKIKFHSKLLIKDKYETEIDALYTAIYNGPFKVNKSEIQYVEFVNASKLKKMRTKLTPHALKCFKQIGVL